VALLTAGVDVQGDRIEVQVVGWGRDEESWVVDYRILWGDPSGPRLWADLDTFLRTAYVHAKAVPDLAIRAVAVDTGGHHTKAAYEFCRTRLARRIWAIKGRGGPGVPVWPRRPTRTNKGKIPLFLVGVDAVKDAIYARLKLAEPGPGAVHFPRRLDADYFRQLTAERVVTRFEKGRPIRSWQPKRDGERNEALDTFVYATAALHGLITMGLRLNEEAEAMTVSPRRKNESEVYTTIAQPVLQPVRSRWMG
jgi:phage terminase large subunit GpA-like protein